jgi:hypothetical protein|nr:MAG TPA: Helicase ATPase REPLICATION [Crassvirales sp.]
MEEKDLFDRALENLKVRRQRILDGKINCIPLSFPRLRAYLPGIEKRRYNIITANQKIGKSKLADYILVYEPFFYAIEHPDQLRLKILYFTLEMGKEEKFYDFLCHLLYRLDRIRIGPTDLKSTSADKPVPQEILDLIDSERYQKYIRKFREIITYIDSERNPTGINKYCRNFALSRGKFHFKKIIVKNELGLEEEKEAIDYYEPDDKDEYVLVILDNYSNLMQESGMNKMQTIEKMSKYFITQRDQFNFNITAIQHQAQAQEGIENQKLNKMMPSSDGLADCKTTTRDVNLILGLYNPFKYGLKDYEGYDITKFRNNIRFMQVIEDRDNGAAGQVCPLFFDGAVSVFNELPLPTDKDGITKCLNYIENNIRKPINLVFMGIHIRKARVRKARMWLQKIKRVITFAAL